MITALDQRNNFLLELIHKVLVQGSTTPSNVNITGDTVGLNKEVTQLQVVTELQNILAAMTEVSETIWVDATNTFFLRRLVYDEQTGTTTVSYTLPDGTAYAPTLPIRPASNSTDIEIAQTQYVVINSGTGYATGDFVTQVKFYDTSTVPVTLLETIYINDNTNTVIYPSVTGELLPRSEYFRSKMERIKGAADYDRTIDYYDSLIIGSNINYIVHTGTTALGSEQIIETFTYVDVSQIGSNVTNISYS